MSKTYRRNDPRKPKPEYRVSIRAVRRDQPDVKKLSKALIALALQAEAEKEAQSAKDSKGVRS